MAETDIGNYLKVNDTTLYYEKRGNGAPIILLHGNGENLTIFNDVAKMLALDNTVYAVDTRGHGKSDKTDTFHYADMADDIVGFIIGLKLEKPVLYGFSDGGIVGLLIAINHPDLLGKLIVSGANLNPDGLKSYFIKVCKIARAFMPKSKRGLFELMLSEPDISTEDLKKITIPTFVLAGQHDIIKQSHTENIAAAINTSDLRIIKGESHGSYVLNAQKLYPILSNFLSKN